MDERKAWSEQRMNNYSNTWQHELQKVCCVDPAYCFLAMLCAPCMSYSNRVAALHGDMRFYTCCQGTLPCSGRMKEEQCPEMCLCLEVSLCFPNSVMATRYLLQDEMQIQNTKCDNALISCMVGLQALACFCYIASIFEESLRETAQIIDCAADMVYCSVCACMQTQHKKQIEYRNANMSIICSAPNNPMLAPPQQVMQDNPNLKFQYPQVQHGGTATGYPVA